MISDKKSSMTLTSILQPLIFLALPSLANNSLATPVCWEDTGHCYERVEVSGGITWYDAATSAEAKGGHLATVTSAEENVFIVNNLGDVKNYWLGGFQPPGSEEPSGGWIWITGEPFSYSNWSTHDSGEPSNGYGQDYGELPGVTAEDGLAFWRNDFGWNDIPRAAYLVPGYILEVPGASVSSFSKFLPRAEFSLGPQANDDSFWVRGWLKLADTSNGINPLTEAVTMKVGPFSHTLPAGSFAQEGDSYVFKGPVGASVLDVRITPSSTPGGYSFKSCLKNGDLEATTMKPQVQLTIGDDSGQATLDVGYAKFGKGAGGQKWVFPPAK